MLVGCIPKQLFDKEIQKPGDLKKVPGATYPPVASATYPVAALRRGYVAIATGVRRTFNMLDLEGLQSALLGNNGWVWG